MAGGEPKKLVKKPESPDKWKYPFRNKDVRHVYLAAVEFNNPEWIPCSISIFPAVWKKYRGKLKKIAMKHPFLFGTLIKYKINYDSIPLRHRPNTTFTDNWGCVWKNVVGGFEGQVVGNPLANWDAFKNYKMPDPLKYTEDGKRPFMFWTLSKWGAKLGKKRDILVTGGAERLFDRLYFLRGFENLMRDLLKNDPRIVELIQKLTEHELKLIKKWLEVGVDVISFHTDIGTQDRLMISPRLFRKFIKPMFTELFQTCRKGGAHVYLSSDGNLLEIVDDLIECGVSVHDPQLRACGLDGIKNAYGGKLCVDLDLDRQSFPFASPEELDDQIAKSVERLYLPEGGLMMKTEISDTNVSLENIEAICVAMEKYCFSPEEL